MRIFRLTKRKIGKTDFEETFDDLFRMGLTVKSAAKTYKMLKNLDSQTPKPVSDSLIFELGKINYD